MLLATIDLKDAYYSLSIRILYLKDKLLKDKMFLGFAQENSLN